MCFFGLSSDLLCPNHLRLLIAAVGRQANWLTAEEVRPSLFASQQRRLLAPCRTSVPLGARWSGSCQAACLLRATHEHAAPILQRPPECSRMRTECRETGTTGSDVTIEAAPPDNRLRCRPARTPRRYGGGFQTFRVGRANLKCERRTLNHGSPPWTAPFENALGWPPQLGRAPLRLGRHGAEPSGRDFHRSVI